MPYRERICRNNSHQESHRQILLPLEPARTVKVWVDYLRQHKFPEVWSLWEVPFEPSKRQELLAWPADCKPARLQYHLDNDYNEPAPQHSAADALGLTLLCFGSLYGREQASEGEIWPSVASRFPPESRTVLSARRHRVSDLKGARKSCDRHLELVCILGAVVVRSPRRYRVLLRSTDGIDRWLGPSSGGYEMSNTTCQS